MAKLDYAAFIAGQEAVYTKFRNSPVKTEGVKISGAVSERHQGYMIALRHPASITDPMSAFAERITKTVPSFGYTAENAHTTLFITGLVKNECFNQTEDMLKKLTRAANVARSKTLTINYPEWLYNQDAVIVAGMPTFEFCETIDDIALAGASEGLELRLPWGSHITAARYTAAKAASELSDFFALMKEAPFLGVSKPTRIDVGNFYIGDSEGYNTCLLHVAESIPLK